MAKSIVVCSESGREITKITPAKAKQLIKYNYAIPYEGDDKAIYTKADALFEFEKILKELDKKIKEPIKAKCWECGKEIKVEHLNKRPYCDECKKKYSKQFELDQEQYFRYRTKFMLNRAMRILENQKNSIVIEDYKEAYDTIKEYTEKNYKKFDSAHEMVAAMELIKNYIHIKIQPYIGKHRLDFLIEEFKAVLEVDGFLHKNSLEKDYQSDVEIRKELGAEWEIVRIPTEYIEQNITQLIPAIEQIRGLKQKTRQQNNGMLPEWYSARDKAMWKQLDSKSIV